MNTEHWNTKHNGIQKVLKFCFPMVQKQDFIYKQKPFSLDLKWSRLAKSYVFPMVQTIKKHNKMAAILLYSSHTTATSSMMLQNCGTWHQQLSRIASQSFLLKTHKKDVLSLPF